MSEDRCQRIDVESGTSRPIGQDYAAAKDAEVGKSGHSAEGMVHSGGRKADDRR